MDKEEVEESRCCCNESHCGNVYCKYFVWQYNDGIKDCSNTLNFLGEIYVRSCFADR
jgi:hypothetical protein